MARANRHFLPGHIWHITVWRGQPRPMLLEKPVFMRILRQIGKVICRTKSSSALYVFCYTRSAILHVKW